MTPLRYEKSYNIHTILIHCRGVVLMLLSFALISFDCNAQNTSNEDYADNHQSEDPLIFDASDFLQWLQKDHYIVNAGDLEASWIFNNTALYLGSRSNYVKTFQVPEDGTYYLFSRTHGQDNSFFRVAVNDEVIDSNIGDRSLTWDRSGVFELEEGEAYLRLMRIENGPVLDVLVLTKDKDFSEKELKKYELHPDVKLLKSYEIPNSNAVKFGDLNSDGKMDFTVLTPDYSLHAFNHEGEELWSWKAPEDDASKRSSFEAPGLVWDINEDGASEVIHWRQSEEQEWLVVADGETGEIKHQVPWPTKALPHDYNNFRLAIGNLKGGFPNEIIVFTDMGGQINITAYDNELNLLWQHEEIKKKDHLGHYVYPVDLDDDEIDEVVVGSMVLDADGEEIWNRFDLFYDHHDHVDSYRFADITNDGNIDILTAHSEFGVVAFEAMTGEIIWQDMGEHTQQLEVGNFLEGVEDPQIAIGARTYGKRDIGEPYLWSQVRWFSAAGELLHVWPETPINGNPVFVKGDWNGNDEDELFWYKFRLNQTGEGDLYFGEPVFHMFDFMGNNAEEVITLEDGELRVYGSHEAFNSLLPQREKNADYLRKIANHTHY